MKFLLGVAALLIFLVAGAIPAGAVLQKSTVSSITDARMEIQVSATSVDMCNIRITDTNTVWLLNDVKWKQDITETIRGSCDGGTTLVCSLKSVVNLQNTGTLLSPGICWFSYPDGSKSSHIVQVTLANGALRVDLSKWT